MSRQGSGRSGLIARKVGMTRIFNEEGRVIPVTVLSVEPNVVMDTRTEEKNGYTAIQVGFEDQKESRMTKPMLGHFKKCNTSPKKTVKEFRVTADNLIEAGETITVEHFAEGQKVDVSGTSIGKGFQGAMKRHNFGGMRASHGVSISHRAHGSTGQCQDPGKVFKGKKMAGHMGDAKRTQQNLVIAKIDADKNALLVKGSVPGAKGSLVFVQDAVKNPPKAN